MYRIPFGELKTMQKAIQKKMLAPLLSHKIIHAYTKKRSTLTMARLHVGKQFIVKLDIRDFFPSIRPGRVCEMFKNIGLSGAPARLLTNLVTYDNQLPQGPPTSPDIAKQVLASFCDRLENLCSAHGLTPGVYGDDIYVSGSVRAKKIKNLLVHIIKQAGFDINENKIKVMEPGQRKEVTGIVVNEKLNIPKEYYRNLRAELHACQVKGPRALFGKDLKKGMNELKGKINQVKQLNKNRAKNLEKQFDLIVWSGS